MKGPFALDGNCWALDTAVVCGACDSAGGPVTVPVTGAGAGCVSGLLCDALRIGPLDPLGLAVSPAALCPVAAVV